MDKKIYSAIILAVGIAVAGFLLAGSIHQVAQKDRAVSVKGLSTRDVKADYVVWPLELVVTGNDLQQTYQRLSQMEAITRAYFVEKGFADSTFRSGSSHIEDNWSYNYDHRPENRYTIRASLIISTSDVDRVVANQNCQAELMSKGVITNSYQWNTDYQYNALNTLKPVMIEEATKNARIVAQKFADDAECSLGSIYRANQGQFTITADDNQPWIKHVRVVTTIDYYLK